MAAALYSQKYLLVLISVGALCYKPEGRWFIHIYQHHNRWMGFHEIWFEQYAIGVRAPIIFTSLRIVTPT
jgi:hypothetical protein